LPEEKQTSAINKNKKETRKMFKKLSIASLTLITILTGAATIKASEATPPAAVETKKIADWIEVVAPKSVKVGETVTVKCKLTGIPDGYQFAGDMHFFRGPSYGGFLVWHRALTVKDGSEYVFKYKIPEKEGMSAVGILFYCGKKSGWGNKEKSAWFKFISIEQ
jgi:hypothetical protein